MAYTPTSDAHLAYLAESAGFTEWYELFLDEEFMAKAAKYHNEMVKYIKAKYLTYPCNDFAPDTLAQDQGDGIDWTLVCTTCLHHKQDHNVSGIK